MGAHSFNHQTTSPRKLVNLTEPLYTTTSLEMTPDTFHLPETLQDIFFVHPTITQISEYLQQNKSQSPSFTILLAEGLRGSLPLLYNNAASSLQ